MVTTGSKFFYGLAGVGLLAAIVYGIITNGVDHGGVVAVLTGDGAVDAVIGPLTLGYKGGVGDHLGYAVLLGFAASCFGLGMATSFFRDSDAKALAELEASGEAPVVVRPQGVSFWPIVMAFAAALVMIGLAASPTVFVVGILVGVIAGLEWTVQAWADTATGDPELNATLRARLMRPIEVPVGALIGIAVVLLCISRIFLATAGVGAMIVGVALAAAVFIGAVILSAQPQIRRTALVAAGILFAVAVLAIGIGGAIAGPSEHEKHEPPPAAQQIETGAPADSMVPATLGETD
jgi:hypothetical protein